MNADERQALREKHRDQLADNAAYDWHYCHECETDYPCDVIKVLDATENLNPTDLKTEVECDQDHEAWQTIFSYFVFCPVCGVKL